MLKSRSLDHDQQIFEWGDADWINVFINFRYNHQTWWAVKLFLCDLSNFVVVILNLFFTDWYLGNEFMAFGPVSLDYIKLPPAVGLTWESGRLPFKQAFFHFPAN